jgi:pimeloyl-ACP methyl ester carboxylesterase
LNTESHIVLPDGRRLAYAEFGAHGGRPVLYFHGSPSSRLEPLLVGDKVWTRHGLRVIAPDRPGMGLSDFQPGRGFSHWPADVAALPSARLKTYEGESHLSTLCNHTDDFARALLKDETRAAAPRD